MLKSKPRYRFVPIILLALLITYLDVSRIANADSTAPNTILRSSVELYRSGKIALLLEALDKNGKELNESIADYLYYKTYLKTENYTKSASYLDSLANRLTGPLAEVLLFEKLHYFHITKQKKELLKLIVNNVSAETGIFLLDEINKILISEFKSFPDKFLLRQALEVMIPHVAVMEDGVETLRLYQQTFAANDPRTKEVQVKIWSYDDVFALSAKEKTIVNHIKKRADGYQDQILRHFKQQYSIKNYTYISQTASDYLALLVDKKHETFKSLRELYFKTLIKRRQYSYLLQELDNKKIQTRYGLSDSEVLSRRFELWLKKKNPGNAIKVLEQKKKADPSFKPDPYYLSIAEYYFARGQYQSAANYYQKLHPYQAGEYEVSRIKWKIWWSYYRLGNQAEMAKIINWSNNYSFKNKEIGARFCYWGYKLKLQQKGTLERCHQKYPLTYYGLHSVFRHKEGSEFAGYVKPGKEAPVIDGKVSPLELEKLEFIRLVFMLDNEGIAESVVRSMMKSADSFLLLKMADMLLDVEQYYLVQLIAESRFRVLLESSISGRNLMMPYFYPLAYDHQVNQLSELLSVPNTLILSVMREESHFNPEVVSSAGAIGLMQLMPATAKFMGKRIGMKVQEDKLKKPEINMKLGAAYLRRLLRRYDGNVIHSLAAYNGGPTNVKRWRKRLTSNDNDEFVESITFTETKNYVRRVMRTYYLYRTLYETP